MLNNWGNLRTYGGLFLNKKSVSLSPSFSILELVSFLKFQLLFKVFLRVKAVLTRPELA